MARVLLPLDRVDALIFDMDGVITDTASVHATAWKRLFDEVLDDHAARTGEVPAPFDPEGDYLRYVDGKPRYDGVASFLESRGIARPWGSPDDPLDAPTVCGLGNRKNEYFNDHLRSHGAEAFPSTVDLLDELRARGVPCAVISASKNAEAVLGSAGVVDYFDVRVDGTVADELGLSGKPDPAVFLEAARRLGVEPGRAAVVEDALAGVDAGRRGEFGFVLGVNRADQAAELAARGADAVVSDLAEVRLPTRTTAIDDLADALDALDDVWARLGDDRPVVFLDYDGTLTPIVKDPDAALLPVPTREVLTELTQALAVVVLSGRDRADVEAKIDVEGPYYAGSHGFDISGPGGFQFEHPGAREAQPAIDAAEARLVAAVSDVPGARVERKRYAIAVHYRNVDPADVPDVLGAFDAVAADSGLRRSGGKMIVELRPDHDWHKGEALRWLLDQVVPQPHGRPVYVGDDLTDEDAFAEIQIDGVGVVVAGGDHESAAHWSLADADEVRRFLACLVERYG